MSFPEPMRRQTLQERVRAMPRAAFAGAAALLVVSLGGVAVGFSTCSPQPAFTISMQEQQEEETRDDAAGGADVPGDGVQDSPSGREGQGDSAHGEQAEAELESAKIAVYVSGAVETPGVYELAEDSRVCDALDAAGGLKEDAAADAINLARRVSDGEQIAVPTVDQVESGVFASATAASGTSGVGVSSGKSGPVNINTASIDELDSLAGVGPATAQAIVEEREANGPFSSIEDIQRVSGIGEKKFEKLKESICV